MLKRGFFRWIRGKVWVLRSASWFFLGLSIGIKYLPYSIAALVLSLVLDIIWAFLPR